MSILTYSFGCPFPFSLREKQAAEASPDWGHHCRGWGRRCERCYEATTESLHTSKRAVREVGGLARRLVGNFRRKTFQFFFTQLPTQSDSDRWIEGWKCFLISKVFGDTFYHCSRASHLSSEKTFDYSTPKELFEQPLLCVKKLVSIFLEPLTSFFIFLKREYACIDAVVSLYSIANIPRGFIDIDDGCLRRSRCVTQISSIPFG